MDKKVFQPGELRAAAAVIVGTRPGIIMLAPLIHEFRTRHIEHFVIHTGQHYSPNMDAQFFAELALPQPDERLEGVAERRTHGGQTARMIEGIEQILMQRRPCLILVGGDANTNLAGALAARKLGIAVGHIEAGERSYDWSMPEEHNRVMIDHISDLLFVTGAKARDNLLNEGVRGAIHITGNPIVDASRQNFALAAARSTLAADLRLKPKHFALITMHREENVDAPQRLRDSIEGSAAAARELGLPLLFLIHPRTWKRLREFGLADWAASLPGILLREAVGYLDFLALLGSAALVFTDSGGVQQEACIHRVPCVTLRENTEWTETLAIGANRLAGADPQAIRRCAREALTARPGWGDPFGDGNAARDIAAIVSAYLVRGPMQTTSAPDRRQA